MTIQDDDFFAKVAIVYDHPTDVKILYKNKRLYNIHIFNPSYSLLGDENIGDNVVYRMFTVCRFCSDGKDSLDWINTWRYSTGFEDQIQFKMSFTANFHRATVTTGVDENLPPNFVIIGQDEKGNYIHDGISYREYMAFGTILNLT